MNPLQDAFISYGRADSKQFAQALNDRLVDLGYTIWFDFEDIPLGVDYQRQIDDGIDKADNFLFVISPHSVNSPYCELEIDLALKQGKRIIPLLHVEQISRETWQQRNLDGTDANWTEYQAAGKHTSFKNMHPAISKINWVYFREGQDDYEQSFQGLLELLSRQKDYVHQHTVLLNQALDWERNQKRTRYLLIGEERQQAEAWLSERFQDEQAPCLPTDLHCEYITESIKNANNLMTQVFLCHAEADREIAEKVRRGLMRAGITTWTHRSDIEYGRDFQAAMKQGLEEADNVVFLLSPHALASAYCQQELNHALELNKRIIPLRAGAVDAAQIPASLQTLQYIDLTDNQSEADYQQDESDLLRILQQDFKYYREHKVLLAKSLKWQRDSQNPCMLLRGYELQSAETWLKLSTKHPQHGPTELQKQFITESQYQPSDINLDVFVSYSRADSDFARKLNEALQRQGKRTWFDQESIASGADFKQEIYKGIEASDHFLFIISPSSVNSPYCDDEVEYAASLNKRIVTVRHRAVAVADLHPELERLQWIDFLKSNDGDFGANFQELLRTLEKDPTHLQAHTRLLNQALVWNQRSRRESLLLRGEELSEAEQWLLKAAGKQPSPTELQGEYVAASRKTSASRQRSLVGILGTLLILALAGGSAALWQSRVANRALADALDARNAEAEQREVAEQKQQEVEDALVEATEAKDLAEERRLDAEEAQVAEAEQRDLAEQKQQEAEEALADAEAAQVAEAEQRDLAEQKQQEAEENAAVAREQTKVAENATTTAELEARSAEVRAGSSAVEARISSGQHFQALLLAVELGRKIKSLNSYGLSIHPDINLQAISTLQKSYHLVRERNSWTTNRNRGNFSEIWDLDFSPDSQMIVSATGTKVHLWDFQGNLLETLAEQPQEISSVSFFPDGQRILSADENGFIKILDLTGNILRRFRVHFVAVLSLRFSPNGEMIVSTGADGTARIWDLEGNILKILEIGYPTKNVDFSYDSRKIITPSARAD